MGNDLRIDRMSLRDEKNRKFGFGAEITVKIQSLYPITSRRDKFGHDIKIDIFLGNFGSMVEV